MSYKYILLIIAVIIIILIGSKRTEYFDKTGTVFTDIGEKIYDLKGERIYFFPPDFDIPNYQHFRCHH